MNVTLYSDLHLEFDVRDFDPGTGDVLILAGDICVAGELLEGGKMARRYKRFFDACVAGYNKVFYTPGNHEHYNGDFQETQFILASEINPGVSLLNNRSEFYNGWHFVGTTLWADFEGVSQQVMEKAMNYMTDYHVVTNKNNLLSPHDTLDEHRSSLYWLTRCLPTLNGNVLVFSHHSPSFQSINGRYAGAMQGAYATNLESLIKKNPNVKHWCHGHIHESNNYMIEQCQVLSNPRGYYDQDLNPDFSTDFSLTL